ncbi:MAG TPA: class I SAM-dependent methyltransferase [Gammaproteobacteria bacterium]
MSTASSYVRRDMRSVDGWLHPTSAAAIAELGVGGNAAEIGVHHGKLLILLSLLCDHAYAIDVFDSSRNSDRSGDGDREIFEANMRRYGGAYTTIQTDSALLEPERLPPIRIFSVDGSHTAAMTEHDLRLAARVLVRGGVVILDDYFNEQWPDVSVGANRVIADGTLVPFAITPGKVLLTNGDPGEWLERFARNPAFHSFREMAGKRIAWLVAPRRAMLSRVLNWPLYRALKDRAWFMPLKRAGRRIVG